MNSKVFLAMLAVHQKKYTNGAMRYHFFSVFIIGAIHICILIFTAINSLLLVPAALKNNRSSLHKLLAVLFIFLMPAFSIRVLDTLRLGPTLALFGPTYGFSEISEANGYVAGDSVIMNTVARPREAVGTAGFIGRLNEDEFMLFLKGVDRQHVGNVAAAIRRALDSAKKKGRGEMVISAA